MQDEWRGLPEDFTAFFVSEDRRVRLQLVKLGGSSAASLAGTLVTVIDPRGESTQLTADAKGIATLSNVTAGVHAIVSSGAHGHVAVPLILRELPQDAMEDAQSADASTVSTVKLPLINVGGDEVMRVANSFLPPMASAAALDDEWISAGEVVPAHRYRIRLDPNGRMEGRVISLVAPEMPQTSLEGMNLMVYSGRQLVGRAITDDRGRFAVNNLRPGPHALIAAGPAGYAAFAFDAFAAGDLVQQVAEETLVSDSQGNQNLVRMIQPGAGGGGLPIVVIPPPMVPPVMGVMRAGFGAPGDIALDPAAAGFAPVPGGGGAAGGGFGGGGGGVGGGAAGGGLGGVGGLLALGGVGAAIAAAASDSDDAPIVIPPVATPAEPGPPTLED